ncbi:hypothetical protein GCM10023065_18390 [Microbacterium laevaniformans]|uniref:hypothetical protein n=1 Tax=Microbacterium laevaniformans TaxID=36807 RepID=UPI00195D0ED9|nr:hypothetical protein [Microbacterium laevaniformans]MBM7752790.1 hypothetical protein [Microbacterium laevaniformans]GLJ64032.1 hypothetical protein GCM10017578_09200 [Microbacterium laevaniformans]
MIVSRPVQYTSDVAGYRRLFAALGLVALVEEADWSVYAAGDGRVALHRVEPGDPLDGLAALGFESDDLDAAANAFGDPARRFVADNGASGVAIAGELELVVLELAPGERRGTQGLRALGLWVSAHVDAAASVLERLGLRAEVRSDSGRWVQLVADAGLAAVHDGDVPAAQVSFEYEGDVDELAARVRAEGVDAHVVDESYGRTLLIPRPEGGEPIWINERQSDLYGYTAL